MRPLRLLVVPALSLALWSCFSVGNWDSLPTADRDRFARCGEAIRPAICGRDTSQVYTVNCMRSAMGRYAEAAGEDGRREWLLSYGCPPSMVSPEAYVVSSGGSAARPQAAAPPPAAPSARDVPDRNAVMLVMQEVQRRSESCLPLGTFQLRLVYGNDGNVILVTGVSGDVADSVLACVRENARAVPPFSRSEFSVSYPFQHM